MNKDSIVYSLGIGEDISFDLSIIKKYGVRLYALDPIPRSIRWTLSQKLPSEFHLLSYGVSDHDGIQRFHPPKNPKHISYTVLDRPETAKKAIELEVRRISTIMKDLRHKKIDIIKMNIEGAEYVVVKDILECRIDVNQLLIGFHHQFPGISIDETSDTIDDLRLAGYKVFNISYTGRDYSLIRAWK